VVPLPEGTLRQLAARFRAVARRGGIVVGGDTGPVRLAAAAGAPTVGLFGPTLAVRYGIGAGVDLQGRSDCPHRLPTLITEQVCWWDARCPLSPTGPACMADIPAAAVASAVTRLVNTDQPYRTALMLSGPAPGRPPP
jgi:ADP-heptose:LPS heptosyltransferase